MYPEKTYNISDRFFLGGPLNVRGFEMRGVGPQSDGAFTGADVSTGRQGPASGLGPGNGVATLVIVLRTLES